MNPVYYYLNDSGLSEITEEDYLSFTLSQKLAVIKTKGNKQVFVIEYSEIETMGVTK